MVTLAHAAAAYIYCHVTLMRAPWDTLNTLPFALFVCFGAGFPAMCLYILYILHWVGDAVTLTPLWEICIFSTLSVLFLFPIFRNRDFVPWNFPSEYYGFSLNLALLLVVIGCGVFFMWEARIFRRVRNPGI